MERSLRLGLVLTAIAFALSVVILLAIDFGVIEYSTTVQAQRAKEVVIAGMILGALWVVILMLSCLGLFGRMRKVLLGKRSVSRAYILSNKSVQEETR